MHCAGELSFGCPCCEAATTVGLERLAFRHTGTWEPSLVVVERFAARAELPCGHAVELAIESSDGFGGPGLRVLVEGTRVDAPGVRLWYGPGGVPMEAA